MRPAATAPPLKIGVIGTGRVGSALARHWAKAGHELMLSSRHPETLQPLATELAGKVIIDASNPSERRDGAVGAESVRKGAGIATAGLLNSKRVVRALDCIGFMQIASGSFRKPVRRAIPIGGDDADALAIASRLVSDAGFDPAVIGSLAHSRVLDLGEALSNGD